MLKKNTRKERALQIALIAGISCLLISAAVKVNSNEEASDVKALADTKFRNISLGDLTPDTVTSALHFSVLQDMNKVYLAWVVRDQPTSGYYVIEKYVPGKGQYRYIGFIRSNIKDSKQDKLYSFVDNNPAGEASGYKVWFFGDNASFFKTEAKLVTMEVPSVK